MFEADIGAEAIYNIFKRIDLHKLAKQLEIELEKANSIDSGRINKRLATISAMIHSNCRPEWMFLTAIPVIPPALRPMVPLDGGRYATSRRQRFVSTGHQPQQPSEKIERNSCAGCYFAKRKKNFAGSG